MRWTLFVLLTLAGCQTQTPAPEKLAPAPTEEAFNPSEARYLVYLAYDVAQARTPHQSAGGLWVTPHFNGAAHSHGGDPAIISSARLRLYNPGLGAHQVEVRALALRESKGGCNFAMSPRQRPLHITGVREPGPPAREVTSALTIAPKATVDLEVAFAPRDIVAECYRRDYVFGLVVDGVAHEVSEELEVIRYEEERLEGP